MIKSLDSKSKVPIQVLSYTYCSQQLYMAIDEFTFKFWVTWAISTLMVIQNEKKIKLSVSQKWQL